MPPLLPLKDGYLFLDKVKFPDAFAGDVDLKTAVFMADSQVPWGVNALGGAVQSRLGNQSLAGISKSAMTR